MFLLMSAGRRKRQCNLCAKNGPTLAFVSSHYLHDPETKVVQCPILRKYRCEFCNATGEFAHTRKYCPLVRMQAANTQSTAVPLMSTQWQSDGMTRKINFAMKTRFREGSFFKPLLWFLYPLPPCFYSIKMVDRSARKLKSSFCVKSLTASDWKY
jgi:hypothetical protein